MEEFVEEFIGKLLTYHAIHEERKWVSTYNYINFNKNVGLQSSYYLLLLLVRKKRKHLRSYLAEFDYVAQNIRNFRKICLM